MDNNDKIDFVLPWVDGGDPRWQAEYQQYSPGNALLNTQSRFTEWDNLQYLFRAFEESCSWVNKIYFITWGHLPSWLNTEHPKLVIVNHQDYLPSDALPVFSSHPIELNLHRIEGLSEKFVYFNDDCFILDKVKPTEFFKEQKPVDYGLLDVTHDGTISHIVLNNIDIINKHFNRHVAPELAKSRVLTGNLKGWFSPKYGVASLLQNLLLMKWKGHTGFVLNHHPQPLLKSTLEEVWKREPDALNKTTYSRFRDNQDVSQYLFRYWQLVSGKFSPGDYRQYQKQRKYVEVRTKADAERVASDIHNKVYRMLCINDAIFKGRYTKEDMSPADFEHSKFAINQALATVYPDVSSFEKRPVK